jgi:hypothetical protein
VGLILIFISWIFAIVGFFSMRAQFPQYSQTQSCNFTPSNQPAQPTQAR